MIDYESTGTTSQVKRGTTDLGRSSSVFLEARRTKQNFSKKQSLNSKRFTVLDL